MLRVLFDGWPLIYHPNSPAALHLLALLALCPDGVEPAAALPAGPPAWFPNHVNVRVRPTANTSRQRLRWEQRVLPALFHQTGASLLHLTSAASPLFARTASVFSPTTPFEGRAGDFRDRQPEAPMGLFERLRLALGQGGLSRAQAVFWPEDLPPPQGVTAPVLRLPAIVHPAFIQTEPEASEELAEIDLPESYVLYHGPSDPQSLGDLFDAWSWAQGSIGTYYPLLLLGVEDFERERVEGLVRAFQNDEYVRILPRIPPLEIPVIYRRSSALFHPAPVPPWGGPVRHALACRIPVVAADSTLADAMVGEAAYLSPAGDARALGAALITVVIEEGVGEMLSNAARQRTAGWEMERFARGLLEAYRKAVAGVNA